MDTGNGVRTYVSIVVSQANRLAKLVEVLKDFLTDTVTNFSKDGIKIATIDAKHVALINLRLFASSFESYTFYEESDLGISIPQLYRNLRSLSSGTTLRMDVVEKNGYRGLQLSRMTRNIIEDTRFMIGRGLEDEEYSLEPHKYDINIRLDSDDLQYVCKEISNSVEDAVTITVLERAIRFSAKSQIGLQEGEMTLPLSVAPLDDSAPADQPCQEGSKKRKLETEATAENKSRKTKAGESVKDYGQVILRMEYLMKYLRDFSKAAPLSSSVLLQIDQQYPLMLTYQVSDMGELKLAVSPSADNELPRASNDQDNDQE